MAKLTAIEVKNLKTPGRYGDGQGLYLRVRDDGRKGWVLRYMINKVSRDMGLGSYPDISLAAARDAAGDARQIIRSGRDPIEARKQVPIAKVDHSFRAAAESMLADRGIGWRNEKHAWQWRNTLERFAYPVIGTIDVQDVTTEHIMDILRPIWGEIPETASRVRGRIEAVIDAARASGQPIGANVARWKGHLATRLPPPTRVRRVVHHPSLPWQQMPDFMRALRGRAGFSARALEFTILTAARSGEVRGMTWSEIDLDAAIWTVPADRMKMGRVHRVPLSDAACSLLRAAGTIEGGRTAHVFPGEKSAVQSNMGMVVLLRRMNGARSGEAAIWKDGLTGEPIVPHGFRSTFRDWAAEATPYPREVAEAALAHAKGSKVEAAYARTDLLERRRPMMDDWGRWCGIA